MESFWMTAEDAARYLKVPRKTLLVWARRGQIRGYQLSGTQRHIWRFKQEDLDAAMLCRLDPPALVESLSSSAAR